MHDPITHFLNALESHHHIPLLWIIPGALFVATLILRDWVKARKS